MEQNTKDRFWVALRVVGMVAVLAVAYAALSYVSTYSQSIEPSSFRSFSVAGEGKITAIPDIASFSFSVVTEGGKDIGALLRENTEKTNAAVAFVKDKGIETKDIKTSQYSLSPRYQYYGCEQGACPPAEIVGYTITQTVAVKVRDFSKIGELLSGVLGAGANTVSSLQFAVDEPTAAQQEARAEAIEKAKVKAEEIADAAGFRVGRLLSIDEGYSYYYPKTSMDMYGRGGGAVSSESAPAPSIEPGSQEVTVNVTLRYEIR